MKILVVSTLVILATGPDVRFEAGGVRVGEALVEGEVLELKASGTAALLASGSSVEALASALEVRLAPDRVLTLEPGLRVSRTEAGFRFSAHQSLRIRLAAAGETILVASPATVAVTADGWLVGDRPFAGPALRAGLEVQDEENNLDKMIQAKDRLRPQGLSKLSNRTTRLFRGNPLTSLQAADSISVRQIPQVTPSGAP